VMVGYIVHAKELSEPSTHDLIREDRIVRSWVLFGKLDGGKVRLRPRPESVD
jgi:hypothetical protein